MLNNDDQLPAAIADATHHVSIAVLRRLRTSLLMRDGDVFILEALLDLRVANFVPPNLFTVVVVPVKRWVIAPWIFS